MMSRAALSLIISVSLLFAIGLLMVFDTTSAEIIDRSLKVNPHAVLFKQVAYGGIGILMGIIVFSVGFEKLLQWSPWLLIITTVLLIFVFIPGIGQTLNGARRWVGIGGASFQPSECAKILIPLCFIHWIIKQDRASPVFLKSFLIELVILLIPFSFILLEPDNGTAAIICSSLLVLFLLSRIPSKYWAFPLLSIMVVGAIVASQMPHVQDRLRVYLHPEIDILGKGHQPYQAKIAAGSGGLLGVGVGESLQKLNYLPEARSDYIAAIYAEEFGFVGVVGVILLYMTIAISGFFIALTTKDLGAFLVAALLAYLISIQAFLNLGIVSGLLPSKGMTLPFFSHGGSSLIMNFISLFILLDISRKTKKVERLT